MLRWRGRTGPPGLVGECEAFLSGRFDEVRERAGGRPVAWVWLNPIAHAPVDDLRRMAHYELVRVQPDRAIDRWAQAASYLAAELLQAASDRPGAVRQIQVDALVPIELAWISDTGPPRPLPDLVREVRTALVRAQHGRTGGRHGRV